MTTRPSKHNYYLGIAKAVSQRSTCLRLKCGAIIVVNDQIVSTGYVGSPRGEPNCCDVGVCERDRLNIPAGKNYELCKSVHAEMNAMLHAGRERAMGGSLYIYQERLDGRKEHHNGMCLLCSRMATQIGIEEVFYEEII